MSGGRMTGWTQDVAFVLWRRILGILGNVNQIKHPELHERVFTYLHKQWDYLHRVRENLGISLDNQATPPLPDLVPPLHVFVPWCTESFQLPSTHQNGKLLALELLCRVYVVSQYNDDYQMDYTSLSQFYQLLHQCLLDTQDPYVMYKVLKSCSGGFFGAALPGSFLLYEDFLFSIEQFSSGLASSALDDECPREEAQLTAQSLVFLSKALVKLEAIEQTYDQSINLVKCANLQERLAEFLIYSCRADPSGRARCVGFNAMTQWIVSELQSDSKSTRIGEAISVAVLSLFSDDVSVARFACSTLRCCVKLIPQLLEYSTLLVESTITALALVTSKLLV